MKPAPWHDRLYVAVSGGVRIRIEAGAGAASVAGRVAGPPPPRLVEIVRDLARGDGGVVDLSRDARGHWSITGRGQLATASFEQRLRNVLGNL